MIRLTVEVRCNTEYGYALLFVVFQEKYPNIFHRNVKQRWMQKWLPCHLFLHPTCAGKFRATECIRIAVLTETLLLFCAQTKDQPTFPTQSFIIASHIAATTIFQRCCCKNYDQSEPLLLHFDSSLMVCVHLFSKQLIFLFCPV